MKKILILFAFLLIAVPKMNAQVRPEIQKDHPGFANAQGIEWNTQHAMLLDTQNRLLDGVKTATIISLAGGFVGGIGSSMVTLSAAEGNTSPAGTALVLVGGSAAAVGGVWLLINEFKLINNQKQINDHLKLRLNPGGVALEF